MLCENCKKNNATTYIKTVINGKVTEKHLCSTCAAKEEGNDFLFGDVFSNVFASLLGDTVALPHHAETKRCKCCGSSFYDIKNSGKLGCSECYSTFFEELLPYLNRVHGSVKHIGKTVMPTENDLHKSGDNISSLKEQLKELIKAEKFEEAAIIRDKIKEIEEGEK